MSLNPLDHPFIKSLQPVTLPWPPLKIPPYRAGTFGEWRLAKRGLGKYFQSVRGYYSGFLRPDQDHWVLTRGKDIWMSVTPQEIETQMPHVAAGRGHVVVAGLGMAIALLNFVLKKGVTGVTVLERDSAVIDLFHHACEPERWSKRLRDKITIVETDALTWQPWTGVSVDVLYADIWLKLGAERAVADMQTMQRNIRATHVGWWGQEMDFMDWAARTRVAPAPALALEHYRMWADSIALPVIEQECEAYPQLAVRAMINTAFWPNRIPHGDQIVKPLLNEGEEESAE